MVHYVLGGNQGEDRELVRMFEDRARRVGVIVVVAAIMLGGCGDSGSDAAAADSGPELSEPDAALAESLRCPEEPQHPDATAVLLVPGTGLTADQAFGLTLEPALAAAGHDVCTVDLVEVATGDIQRSAEHVVAAIRQMDQRYDDLAVVGFSQGVLASRWALTWWPDARDAVGEVIGIAGPNGGAAGTAPLCADACAAALHQMTAGSAFLTALDEAWGDVSGVEITMVASRADTVVSAEEVAAVAGASVVEVQAVCPASEVDHVALLADPVVHAIVFDALISDGPASADRIDAEACGGDPVAATGWDPDALTQAAFGAIVGAAPLDAEPELAGYTSD